MKGITKRKEVVVGDAVVDQVEDEDEWEEEEIEVEND